MVGGQLN